MKGDKVIMEEMFSQLLGLVLKQQPKLPVTLHYFDTFGPKVTQLAV
jgi:hypothetical protein